MSGEPAAERRRASLPEPASRGALSAGRVGWTGARQWVTRSSSTVMRTSAAILRSSVGEMSRPECNGTVVTRPSGWRNCLCEPRCRTSVKPCALRSATTSRGFKTGMSPTVRRPGYCGDRRTPTRAAAHHPRAASRSPRGGCPPTRDCPHPGCARRATPGHARQAGWFADHAQRPLGMFSQRAPPDAKIPRMQTVGQRRSFCPTCVVPTR